MADYNGNTNNNGLYPVLQNTDPNIFRLQKCGEVLQNLEKEIKHYEEVRKKYNRARLVFTKISICGGLLSVILSASGLSTSLTGFGAVVGVPLGVVGGIFGGISVCFGYGSKSLSKKVSKHEKTSSIAKSKLSTINDLVSKAFKDGKISDEEFSIILSESEKFEKLKQEVRQKFRKENQKNFDMTIIRKKVREDLLKELTGTTH